MPFDGQLCLSYDEAYEIIGGLSNPSKMPWFSWSTSAFDCKTGSKLREIEGSVCSKCYARKGNYNFPVVKNAHARRLAALDNPRFVEAFVKVLTTLFKGEDRFRWHDSGDLQSVDHLDKIVQIARRTPFIRHYLPTKEYRIVRSYKGEFPPNLFVKVSHPMIGEKYPDGVMQNTAGCDDPSLFQCPARKYQDNKCLSCDACWTSRNVNFPVH